ncbi:MAG: zinc/manganese transport system substrate-binding protein [Ilumatobacter sp.]|jgi:zinc/manganese transport system substrate-binding protein
MRTILTPILAFAAVFSACGSEGDTEQAALPSVVITTSIAGDMVTAALGDLVGSALTVDIITPVGADAHEFAPSARQAEKMENADLLVVNGLGYEEGMTDLIANAIDAGAVVFTLGGALEPSEDVDPHVWLDPVLMSEVFAKFPEAVASTTGVPIADVSTNTSAYVAQLVELDATITAAFAANPDLQRNLVTSHDALSRFADRYGFTIVDTIIPSVSTSAGASAADLDGVLEAIRTNDVGAIFSETTESDALAQAIADELGREMPVIELFTESLGAPGTGADTYIGMMATNAQLIADARS